jgi:pilus assembly protein CpaF
MNIQNDDKTDPSIQVPLELQKKVPSQTTLPPPATAALPYLGLIDPLMRDSGITEIMINDVRNICIEKEGRLGFSGLTYSSQEDLYNAVRLLTELAGKDLQPEAPYLDAMLPDGSRLNIISNPLTLNGPCITIRKFPSQRLSAAELVSQQSMDQRIAYFLNVCTVARFNILICGGTGSGKSTLLNALSTFIPKSERIILIEDTPELSLNHPNSVRLQTLPKTRTSSAVSVRDLVVNALRMRPDRILVGECRGQEAFDILQAMNTGHSGSMTTIHANSPRDGLTRIETLCMLANLELPLTAVRKQIANAIDLVIQTKRFKNGKRRVTSVSEVTGCEGDVITLQDLFIFDAETESFKPTGLVPSLIDDIKELGLELPAKLFS